MTEKRLGTGVFFLFHHSFPAVVKAPAKQPQTQVKQLDIEGLIKWLERLWLADEQLRKRINEDDWQKFIESLKLQI